MGGPDGIPAILLKKIRDEIALPLALILRKSIDEGKIPDIFKLAYVTPIHKGGSRHKHRLVSLTSHVMKVFERVIKKKIIKHLIEKKKKKKKIFNLKIESNLTYVDLNSNHVNPMVERTNFIKDFCILYGLIQHRGQS